MYCTASTGWCAHLHDRVLNKPTNYQQRAPDPCVRVVYIAGDTLRHQPMGAGHMTVLQLCGPMEFRVLQWCHPMLASTRRTSCCTRIITLYGARKWIQARAPPIDQNFPNFMQFLAKCVCWRLPMEGWRPLLQGILDPPLSLFLKNSLNSVISLTEPYKAGKLEWTYHFTLNR